MTKIAACLIMVTACSSGTAPAPAEDAISLATLPKLKEKGTEYPYTRYKEVTGNKISGGLSFFLHPMQQQKTQVLGLEYVPGMNMRDLFGEELLGTSGNVVLRSGLIRVDSLPIAIPVTSSAAREWRLPYAKQEFTCRGTGDRKSEPVLVICTAGKYKLSYVFSSARGVIQFDDFCGEGVCKYQLMDSQGLLSRAMLDFMGFKKT